MFFGLQSNDKNIRENLGTPEKATARVTTMFLVLPNFILLLFKQ